MDIYQHFRKEERPFIDQMVSVCEEVDLKYVRKLTGFLDPREQMILKSIVGQYPDLQMELFGGGEGLERKRAVIAPDYEVVAQEDFGLVLLQGTYPEKFITIEHKDVLGAFMSSGIKREKLGDLIVAEGMIQMIMAQEISEYTKLTLTSVKKANVQFEEVPLEELKSSSDEWVKTDTTVSSLRLDVVVKEIYRMSRKKALMYIEAGHVKVNFRVVEDKAFQLEEGDMLSVRGKGRSRMEQIQGETKRDRIRITTARLN